MIDPVRHADWWRDGAAEDIAAADDLLAAGRFRHALFFAHLALEKLLKAIICRRTNDLAPRIHNLVRLSDTAGLVVPQEHFDLLADMNTFNIDGRYPDAAARPLSAEDASRYMARAEETYRWLMRLL